MDAGYGDRDVVLSCQRRDFPEIPCSDPVWPDRRMRAKASFSGG